MLQTIRPLTFADKIAAYRRMRFGIITPALKTLYYLIVGRIVGKYHPRDLMRMTNFFSTPMFFNLYGLQVSHPFGITLSTRNMGCDCAVYQNVTIGGSRQGTPTIGHLVQIWASAVVSGNIRIGNCVIVAANAVVTKDVPDHHIVYGHNDIRPLKLEHYAYIEDSFKHCVTRFVKSPGLMLKNGSMMINEPYATFRETLSAALGTPKFVNLLKSSNLP